MLPEGIHCIPLPTPFQIGDVNTWLLRGDPLTLVDAGPLMEETEARLEEGLAALGVAVEDLELLVLTHQHDDHVGGDRRAGAALGRRGRGQRRSSPRSWPTPAASMDADDTYSVALMRRHGVTDKTVETLHGISRAFRKFVGDVAVDRIVADGDELVRRRGRRGGVARARRATARPTSVLAGRRVCCSPATTCWRRSPPTRSRTCRSARPTRRPSPRLADSAAHAADLRRLE